MVPLAKLAREYADGGRRVDGFFRGARRTLSDLTDEEFSALRGLLTRVDAIDDISSATIELIFDEGVVNYVRPFSPEEAARRKTANDTISIGTHPHALRLFQLLKIHGLGNDATSGGFGASTGPHVVVLDRNVVHRLSSLVT